MNEEKNQLCKCKEVEIHTHKIKEAKSRKHIEHFLELMLQERPKNLVKPLFNSHTHTTNTHM